MKMRNANGFNIVMFFRMRKKEETTKVCKIKRGMDGMEQEIYAKN
jgi:hypothetical protein